MTGGTLTSVVVIALAAALAPLIADQLRRWLNVPATVLEISFGILLGPAVLGLAQLDLVVEALSGFGLALLFFLAGYEINFSRIRGEPLRRAFVSWGGSLILGLGVGGLLTLLVGGVPQTTLALGLAVATTALGAILPMVRDAGILPSPLGARILAVGAVGEFAPIVMVAILLSGERPGHATALLLGFAAVAVIAAALATRQAPAPLARLLTTTLGTSGQFAVRLTMLVVLALVWLAVELHLDLVLGAFAAGVVIRQLLTSVSHREAEIVESKLEGIGFGFVIPFFFVATGVQFDLPALLGSPVSIALVPLGLLAFLLVRGVPVALAFRTRQPGRELGALVLYAATSLPLVVVITDLSVANGWLTSADAAGLVGAAMLSVLLYPVLAQRFQPSPGSIG